MKMFELLPRPLGSIFRKLTHLTCNSRIGRGVSQFAIITDTLNKGRQGFGRPRLPNTGHYA